MRKRRCGKIEVRAIVDPKIEVGTIEVLENRDLRIRGWAKSGVGEFKVVGNRGFHRSDRLRRGQIEDGGNRGFGNRSAGQLCVDKIEEVREYTGVGSSRFRTIVVLATPCVSQLKCDRIDLGKIVD